jgi:two-component system KDP operon response regulator KdpE
MTQSPAFSKTRLLVVDDDLVQRRLIAKMAARAGHHVLQADSVREAEARLDTPVDCVTVDLGLSDGIGADVLHLIAEKCPNAQVLLITGASGRMLDHTRGVARENGIEIQDVFLKPFDLVGLRASLLRAREIVWAKWDAA